MLIVSKCGFGGKLKVLPNYGQKCFGVGDNLLMDWNLMGFFDLFNLNLKQFFVLEIELYRFEATFLSDSWVFVPCSFVNVYLNNVLIENFKVHQVFLGDTIYICKQSRMGRFCSLFIGGVIDLSQSITGNGPFLKKGDCLFFHFDLAVVPDFYISDSFDTYIYSIDVDFIRAKVWDSLERTVKEEFESMIFEVSKDSDRMGFRLTHENLYLEHWTESISGPIGVGAVQLLPDGNCVVVMAEGQVTGGYPVLGYVSKESLGCLCQKNIGDTFSFKLVDRAMAEAKLVERDLLFRKMAIGIKTAGL